MKFGETVVWSERLGYNDTVASGPIGDIENEVV